MDKALSVPKNRFTRIFPRFLDKLQNFNILCSTLRLFDEFLRAVHGRLAETNISFETGKRCKQNHSDALFDIVILCPHGITPRGAP